MSYRLAIVVAASVFVLMSCEKRKIPESIQAKPEPLRTTATTTPSASAQPTPSASAPAPAPVNTCPVRLLAPRAQDAGPLPATSTAERVEFFECNAHPKQFDYPECWTYLVEPIEGKHADAARCLPSHVTITLSGWQAMLDVMRAKLVYDSAKPNEAKLILEKIESQFPSIRARPGSVLGTIVFDGGIVSELRFGPGMPSQSGKRSVRVSQAE